MVLWAIIPVQPSKYRPEQSMLQKAEVTDDCEVKKVKHSASVHKEHETRLSSFIDCEKFSSWTRLIHVTAYCLRLLDNLKKSAKDKNLNQCLLPEEKRLAETLWIKDSQREIPDWKKSCSELSPFVEDGIITVGGRVKHSPLTYDYTHPVLLSGQVTLPS